MADQLDHYRLLGRSGLRVSPLSLGTMTFRTGSDWGSSDEEARQIVDTYLERGGNFIDTANFYGKGGSETLTGQLIKAKREQIVLSTKYSLTMRWGDPNGSGNHRKNMVRSVEASLQRLDTDYIDLLYLHVWDDRTPVDEILRAFDDLVASVKVLYIGVSDTPAWQISRMQAIAELRGWSQFCALQIPYNLTERTVERDLMPMAKAMGSHLVAAAQVRVKRWGKSPPRWWRHHRHGKRRPVQGQIGRHVSDSLLGSAHRLARSRSSGRSLEVRGNSNPREMIIQAKGETSLRDRIRLIGFPPTLS